jgi:cobalt-zinc-cadmium efflux system protein
MSAGASNHIGGEHGHSTHGRAHGPVRGVTGILGASLLATLVLVAVELIAGYAAHSIALVSDAVHNLTDVPMLVIGWLASRWAQRPPTNEKTFGYHRAGILAAFVNAMLITLVALGLIGESASRLRHPVEVHATIMLWAALVALVVNGGITLAVHRGRHDLSIRTVWLHTLGDAFSNVAVFAGALVIRWTGARWLDAALGIGIGVLVLWSAAGIFRESGHILLEGMPRNLRLADVASAILRVEKVQEVHDIHIWTLGTDMHTLSCHVRIPDMHMEEIEKVLAEIREVLAREFRINHTTIQFERAGLPAEAGLYMPSPAERTTR